MYIFLKLNKIIIIIIYFKKITVIIILLLLVLLLLLLFSFFFLRGGDGTLISVNIVTKIRKKEEKKIKNKQTKGNSKEHEVMPAYLGLLLRQLRIIITLLHFGYKWVQERDDFMERLTGTEINPKMLRINLNFHSRKSSVERALEREVTGLIPGTGQILLEMKVMSLLCIRLDLRVAQMTS